MAVFPRAGGHDGYGHGVDFHKRGRDSDELFLETHGRGDGTGGCGGKYGYVDTSSRRVVVVRGEGVKNRRLADDEQGVSPSRSSPNSSFSRSASHGQCEVFQPPLFTLTLPHTTANPSSHRSSLPPHPPPGQPYRAATPGLARSPPPRNGLGRFPRRAVHAHDGGHVLFLLGRLFRLLLRASCLAPHPRTPPLLPYLRLLRLTVPFSRSSPTANPLSILAILLRLTSSSP